ncbi:RNA polymerase sigma factor [Jongsikchunia kroppenstedtii]|uniref:RNA polymerase sigma factor n=1 Tax=Jongsikchunia kroppenstedtii TaxID=1121721 RepID=UPI00036943AF|nr:sigma-70 family RNA polymerase sigma factor [Jongsikchunia kroppenstedtii]
MQRATESQISAIFKDEYGRAVSVLIGVLGDIDTAEDAVQEAFIEALRTWPERGLPPSPPGWIITTARNRAIDRIRRESTRDVRQEQAFRLGGRLAQEGADAVFDDTAIPDDRLRLIFTCCHPALNEPARIALTLKLIGGLTTAEVARAFLVPEATVAQRIVRAKNKIKRANIPYRVPESAELIDRLGSVLAVIYLIYTEGHTASAGAQLTRIDLAVEAVRLGRVLATLMPDEPEVLGLLALMLLGESRRPARTTADGDLVPLAEQDRSLWDRDLALEGHELVLRCLRRGRPGPYQLQATIAATHAAAASADRTDWPQILALYDGLYALTPTSVVALNRAVALAQVAGPAAALAEVDALDLDGFHLWHATRGHLLDQLGSTAEATAAYRRAATLTDNDAERRHLLRRADHSDD